MIPAAEHGFVCQFCQCCTIEAQIQGYRVVTMDMKGLVTSYMAHCLINGLIGMWLFNAPKPCDFGAPKNASTVLAESIASGLGCSDVFGKRNTRLSGLACLMFCLEGSPGIPAHVALLYRAYQKHSRTLFPFTENKLLSVLHRCSGARLRRRETH